MIANTKMPSGFTFQQELLLMALKRQAVSGMLMTNPRVTGFSSFAKADVDANNYRTASGSYWIKRGGTNGDA